MVQKEPSTEVINSLFSLRKELISDECDVISSLSEEFWGIVDSRTIRLFRLQHVEKRRFLNTKLVRFHGDTTSLKGTNKPVFCSFIWRGVVGMK